MSGLVFGPSPHFSEG